MKYQELLQGFLYMHSGVVTPAEIAQANTIEKHFVDFKLNILAAKVTNFLSCLNCIMIF